MADVPLVVALPGIAALPSTTVRQIGSQQVIVDPSSVVKELIDNALDARAKSIFVDITTNTIGSIQVKDDGHGVPAEDRSLMCRRYCTSKIRSFQDLQNVGRKWLGFRGEALASMAATSGALLVTTRVEGEPVAVQLKYERNGELATTTKASHPVGTTVKVTNIFEPMPVRIQNSVNNSVKCLAKIRRLMQAYALARPAVRFRLHVLKAKNNKSDFMYAPKANANVEDAVLKIIGKDCGLQCDWTALKTEQFEILAFLPRPTANATKIAKYGAFISVDSRPLSNSRGVPKQIVATFRARLRKVDPSFETVRDPFFYMNVICPPDSYDPNLEPAKDNVMFDDDDLVVSVVNKLFVSFYPEAVVEFEDIEPPISTQQSQEVQTGERSARSVTPISIYEDAVEKIGEPSSSPQEELPRWRSSMYGIDEDDLKFLQEEQPLAVEEEEGLRAKDVSNPWNIARMNAATKSNRLTDNGQLLSPAKSPGDMTVKFPSSVTAVTPCRTPPIEPLTTQTSSRINATRSSLDEELERSIRHVPQSSSEKRSIRNRSRTPQEREQPSSPSHETGVAAHMIQRISRRPGVLVPEPNQNGFASTEWLRSLSNVCHTPALASSAPRRRLRKQRSYNDSEPLSPVREPRDTWFGQPMLGSESLQLPHRAKRPRNQYVPLFPSDDAPSFQNPVPAEADRLPVNNFDIRRFFGQTQGQQKSVARDSSQASPLSSSSRATSAAQLPFSRYNNNQLLQSNRDASSEPQNIAEQLRAYVAREAPPPSQQPLSRSTSVEPVQHSNDTRNLVQIHECNGTRPDPQTIGNYLSTWRSNEVAITPNRQHHSNSPNNARSTGARFQPHEDNNPFFSTDPPRPTRHHTTDAAHRTKSSKLPLERTPPGQRIHDVVLLVSTSVASILQSALKLDMYYNSLEWGYSTDIAFDVFAEPVSEKVAIAWVARIHGILSEMYGRADGMQVRAALHGTIQNSLDARGKVTTKEDAQAPDDAETEINTQHHKSANPDEHTAGLDSSPPDSDSMVVVLACVETPPGTDVDLSLGLNQSNDFPDDMDDDMLMDP